ncbi:hypothetical protein CUU54_01495 [Pectobacterium polaris]|uniref:DUF6453 family protein n=1 Tax=Pectobacterium polaris TaxID=2042057 RepID=UPI000D61150E|nr:DUF6453 family protein [Pectobacterium polaris]MCU1787529.1 hypothetical protein [Pectobacterium polaris]PWD55844.1 hypothetical protein DF209_18225 [Pectobacterium polaris]
MSSDYDLLIYPDILNGKGMSLAGCVSFSYLQTIVLPQTGNRQNQSFTFQYTLQNKTSGSTIVIAPVKTVEHVLYGSFGDYRISGVTGYTVSGNTLTVNVYSQAWMVAGGPNSGSGILKIFEIIDHNSAPDSGMYGLSIYNGVDWSEFTDKSKVGALAFHETVTIGAGGWLLPDSIPNKETALVFADWSSATSSLEFDSVGNRVICNGPAITAEIFIFCSDFTLSEPDYGLSIFDENGVLRFSSENPPMCYPNTSITTSFTEKTLPSSSSLVMLTRYGPYIVEIASNKSQYYNAAIRLVGGTISIVRGSYIGETISKVQPDVLPLPEIPYVILDKSIYEQP